MSFNQNNYAENKISPENFGIYLLSHIILDIPHHSLYLADRPYLTKYFTRLKIQCLYMAG